MKKLISVFLIVMCMAFVGCSEEKSHSTKHRKNSKREKETVETIKETERKEELNHIDISDNEKDIRISIWLNNKSLDINDESYKLDDEQVARLREYFIEYTTVVARGKNDYWPHTDEYPDMFILFTYNVDNQYRYNGALCYPDGWEDMLNYIQSEFEE